MEKLTCPADTKAAKVIKEADHHFQCFLQILGKGLTRLQLSQWISRWWPLPDSAAKWGHTGWPERLTNIHQELRALMKEGHKALLRPLRRHFSHKASLHHVTDDKH